jgi:glycosyltransferase involved in cell wall biosynthesis
VGGAMNSVSSVQHEHANPPQMLSLLSPILGELGSRQRGRTLLKRLGVRSLARRFLRSAVVDRQREWADDVTVLIGIRNRSDHRLRLALRSIREQQYPSALVRALVVDYGSEPEAAQYTADVCREYNASLVRVDTTDVWSRARCLNIGIRRTRTKYLLTSDVDIIFSPSYVAEAVQALRGSPLSVVCSRMLDLPEHTAEALRLASLSEPSLRFHELKQSSSARHSWASHPSIAMTYTSFYHYIRGYDEFYELWGSEDDDLFSRLTKLGLERIVLTSDEAFYLHQWHAKYESIPAEGREQVVKRNAERWRRMQTIVRNDASWGGGESGLR